MRRLMCTLIGQVLTMAALCQTYCPGEGTFNCSGNWFINQVSMSAEKGSSINQLSGCDSYADNTAISANVLTGGSYQLTIKTASLVSTIGVFIDWNRDGTFDIVTEALRSYVSNGTATVVIAVPVTQTSGMVRMRIRATDYLDVANPCGTQDFGEVEDYSLLCFTSIDDIPQTTTPVQYCSASGSPNCAQADGTGTPTPITEVNVMGDNGTEILNPSGCDQYADFTFLSVKMSVSNTYSVSIRGGNAFGTSAVYVDWNDDGDFDDLDEASVESNYNIVLDAFTVSVTPPLSVTPGKKRMRVRCTSITGPSPCGTQVLGEVEDYSIFVESLLNPTPSCVNNVKPSNGQANLCLNQVVTWDSVSGATSYRFHLQQANGTIVSNQIVSSRQIFVSNLQANTTYKYLVVPRDADSVEAIGCDTIRFTTSADADPSVFISPNADTLALCEADTLVISATTVFGTSPISYLWTYPGMTIAGVDTTPDLFVVGNAQGLYTVKIAVADSKGCTSIDSTVIQVFGLPEISHVTANKSYYCFGEMPIITFSSNQASSFKLLSIQGAQLTELPAIPLGNFQWQIGPVSDSLQILLVAIGSNACADTSDLLVIPVGGQLDKPSIIFSQSQYCEGEQAEAVVTNYTDGLSWTGSGISQGNRYLTSTTDPFFVTYSNAQGCSVSSDEIIASFRPIPETPVIKYLSGLACTGDTVTYEVENQQAGVFYQWSDQLQTLGERLPVFRSGTIRVQATNVFNCMSVSDPVEVMFTEKPLPTAVLSSGLPCLGQQVSLFLDRSDYAVFWPHDGSNTDTIFVGQNGLYWAELSTSAGCKANTDTLNLQFAVPPANPFITLSGSLCKGDSVWLMSSETDSNQWSNGSDSSAIGVSESGVFSLFRLDPVSGCSSDTAVVTLDFKEKPKPPVIIQVADTLFAQSGEEGLTFQWFDETNQLVLNGPNRFEPTKGGDYSVRAVNDAGCESDPSSPLFFSGVSIDENSVTRLQVYPNPSSGKVSVDLQNTLMGNLSISTIQGQLVRQINLDETSFTIDLRPGIYLFRFSGSPGTTEVYKVVITE
ncbi:MAG TPA: GEVED domain-containing protein [Luteibaculaceae bacterium]|nr:GEVED domain-containing protein [Luteibaculaceae bacterium]